MRAYWPLFDLQIGEWNEDGTLSVIDRIKNLVKLSNGEYIALEKLESVYKTVMGVSNVCIYGDSLRPKAVALVVPTESYLRQLAKDQQLDVANGSFESLCQDSQVRKSVLDQLLAQAKKSQLKPSEMIFDVYLCHEEWTSTNVSWFIEKGGGRAWVNRSLVFFFL